MQIVRLLFHLLLVRPFVRLILGINLRHVDRLPQSGPAIIIANHNNHIDTFVLMSLFPLRQLANLKAAAAADYFLKNRLMAWMSLNLFGIIPVKRSNLCRRDGNPLADCSAALDGGEILIIYPEGTRGEPECMTEFKTGIAHLASSHPNVPVIPVFLQGMGKVLPKGSFVLVPFVCDVFVGSPLSWGGDRQSFMQCINAEMSHLAREGIHPAWL